MLNEHLAIGGNLDRRVLSTLRVMKCKVITPTVTYFYILNTEYKGTFYTYKIAIWTAF